MSDITFCIATSHDLEDLFLLENLCFTSDLFSRQQYRDTLQKNTADIFIAKQDKKLIAAAIIFYRKNSKIARLYSFAVHPDYRNQGLAAKLQHGIEKKIASRHCEEIRLEVRLDNIPAIHFYKKHGYEILGTYKNFYEDGTDATRMKKDLT